MAGEWGDEGNNEVGYCPCDGATGEVMRGITVLAGPFDFMARPGHPQCSIGATTRRRVG